MRFQSSARSRFGLLIVATMIAVAVLPACSDSGSGGGFKEEKQVVKSRIEKNNAKEAAKPPEAPTSFDDSVRVTPAYDTATNTLTVTLAIREGFHAYAEGEEIGMPVKMVIEEKNVWKVEGPTNLPAGKKKDLGELGTSMILEGTVPVSAKVVGGKGPIEGALKVQVCTNESCDRPRTHDFRI